VSGLAGRTLRDQKRGLIGWGIGIAAMSAMYVAFYPTIHKSAATFDKYFASLPEGVKQIIGSNGFTSPAGYLRSEIFSVLGPILFLVFTIGVGARAIAGEEEAGTLDLLLSTPIRRSRVLTGKAVALLVATVGLAVILWVTVTAVSPAAGLTVPASDLAAASLMLLLVGLSLGSIALAIGCATGKRALAVGIASGYAVFAFIMNGLAASVEVLKPLRPLSIFRWYLDPDPLTTGVHLANLFVFVGIIAVSMVVAFVMLDRRDLAA
jgi:ABC-2 type transport system permease protein